MRDTNEKNTSFFLDASEKSTSFFIDVKINEKKMNFPITLAWQMQFSKIFLILENYIKIIYY